MDQYNELNRKQQRRLSFQSFLLFKINKLSKLQDESVLCQKKGKTGKMINEY